jgi:hypothetical protein
VPIGIAQIDEVLLHTGEADPGLPVDGSLSTWNTCHLRKDGAASDIARSFEHAQKGPVCGKGSVGADQLVEVAFSVTRQLGSEDLDLLREHSDGKRDRVEKVTEGLRLGSIA